MKNQLLSLAKESLIYGVGSVIVRFVSIFALPLFTSYLNPYDYGLIAILSWVGMIIQPIFSLGLTAAMGPSYFQSENGVEKSKVVWNVFILSFISSFVLLIVAWAMPSFLCRIVSIPTIHSSLLSISLTSIVFNILAQSFTQRVRFEEEAKFFVIVSLSAFFINLLLSIFLIVYLNLGVNGYLYSQLASSSFSFLLFFWNGLRATSLHFCVSQIGQLFRLGIGFVPSFAFLFVLLHSSKYFLQLSSTYDIVGIYSIGFNIGMAITLITDGVATAWYPFFMRYLDKREQAALVFSRVFTYAFMFVGAICTAFFFFAMPVAKVLLSELFFNAHIVIGIVALSNFFTMLFNLQLPDFYFKGLLKDISIVQGITMVIFLPVSYALSCSLFGASLAVLLGQMILVLLTFLWKIFFYEDRVRMKYDNKRILLSFILFFAAVFIHNIFPNFNLLFEILKSIVFFATVLILVYRLLSSSEREYIYHKVLNWYRVKTISK